MNKTTFSRLFIPLTIATAATAAAVVWQWSAPWGMRAALICRAEGVIEGAPVASVLREHGIGTDFKAHAIGFDNRSVPALEQVASEIGH